MKKDKKDGKSDIPKIGPFYDIAKIMEEQDEKEEQANRNISILNDNRSQKDH